ncbi:MAG: ABC transporter substrate-binding protein, partial [Acidimicrobiia bacterium]
MWRDFEGNERLDLAESWEQSEDGMTVTIRVREGVKWHDGTDFSAQDYVTMFGYLSDGALAEDPNVVEMSGVLSPITSVEAPDPTTLVITSSVPIPYVVDLLDYWHAIRIDNPEDFGFVATPPVGTGPFRLTSVTPGQRISFEANEEYYQDGQPLVGGFEINLFGGATNLIQNLQAGSVDGLLIANRAELEAIANDDSYY